MPFKKPTEQDLLDGSSFGSFVVPQQTYGTGPARTTASLTGEGTYGATSFNVSDILQGTFAVKDQSDELLILNKAATNDLSSIYSLGADTLSAFGTRGTSSSLSGTSSGATGEAGAQVKQEWVLSLPKTHPTTKATIWISSGKASREMHLPTSENITEDVSQHMQYQGMKPEWKHPWNMDRVGNGIGGGAKIYYNVKDATSVLGEAADTPGQHGAFGILSPQDEQFYCSMAWPYKGGPKQSFLKANEPTVAALCDTLSKSDYTGKKVLVYSVEKQTAVVCTPGDWGPQPYWTNGAEKKASIQGFIIGLSADVHFALGTEHGTEVKLGWVDDSTPVGPYAPTADQALNPISSPSSGGGGETAPVSSGSVDVEDLKYASLKILNHPNCWMGHPGQRIPGQQEQYARAFTTHMANGQTAGHPDEVVFKDSRGRQYLFPSVLNYLWYILEAGFILDYYVGSIGHKQKAGNPSKLSNHASGGAIDINCLGLASENRVYPYSDTQNWRRIADKLFNFLATLPENTRSNEIGCSFAYVYPNNFRVFKDAHPTHLHLGFSLDKTGTLISKLKRPSGTSGGSTRAISHV
jgi:hypothetical protein